MIRVINISKQRIRIFTDPGTVEEDGWLGLNPGVYVDLDEDTINNGWLYILEQNGIVRIEEI